MTAYTKEQMELINEIRRLKLIEKLLSYEESMRFTELLEQANAQNLCWW